MPYKIVKKNGVFKLYNIHKKNFVNVNFKSKKSAINQGKNYMRYRNEKPILKGNLILNKKN